MEGDSSKSVEPLRLIECLYSVLRDMRAMVLERFNRMAHGGPEVFGVLFGVHDGDLVRIMHFEPLPGEVVPSMPLADADRLAFEAVLIAAHAAELKLEPVGWFRAYPRSELALSERDREIFDAQSPEPWQVAMILRPGNTAPTRGRIYFREPDGSLRAEAGFQELTQEAEETIFPATEQAEPESPAAAPDPVPEDEILPPRDVPQFNTPAAPSKSVRSLTAIALVVLLAAIGGLALYRLSQPARLALGVADSAGQLRITWDRDSRAVRDGTGAHLEITDGIGKIWVELDREQLRSGNFTYARQSSSVMVRLQVERAGHQPIEEIARFLGAPPEGAVRREMGSASRSAGEPAGKTAELVVSVPVEPPPAAKPAVTPPAGQQPPPKQEAKAASQEPAPPTKTEAPKIEARYLAHANATPGASTPQLPDKPVSVQAAAPASPHPGNGRTTAPVEPTIAQNPAPHVTSPVQVPPQSPIANPAPPPSALQNAVRPPAAPRVPASGRLIWIGRLKKNELLTISGKTCSAGTLIGELPGKMVKLSVSPGDLSSNGIVLYTSNLQYANNVVEPPSEKNGWNQTTYTLNTRYANDVVIEEAPSEQNAWSRVVLRSKNPKLSVIVIDWALVN